jgi:hypothetical protein
MFMTPFGDHIIKKFIGWQGSRGVARGTWELGIGCRLD